MTQPHRAEVERLWAQHLARPFPPDLRGVAVGDVEVVLLDADIAGFISSWLGSGRLDRNRQRVLAQCMDEARRLATLLTDSTDAAYFAGLQGLARAVLDADDALSEFPPPRAYLACRWTHSNAEDPMLILSELDGARYEVRKVHEFADGGLERADRIADAATSLSWVTTPSEAEIDAQDEFEVLPLTADQFEDYWRRAMPSDCPSSPSTVPGSMTSMGSCRASQDCSTTSSGGAASTPSPTSSVAAAARRTAASSFAG